MLLSSPLFLAASSIVLWSTLGYLGTLLTHVPPFLMVGVAFLVGSIPGLRGYREFKTDGRILATGIAGLFGYHFCLFMAFRLAPPVDVLLVNYLWPVLIVLFTPLVLKGFALRWYHVAGGLVALVGALAAASGGAVALDRTHAAGLALAGLAAVIWAGYSVYTKKLPPFSTLVVSQFCLVSGLLALATHAVAEPATVLSARDWCLLVALGLGPMGIAFYTWDAALKRGDPRVVGTLSYLTPLLSTLLLVVLGGKPFDARTAVSLALIVGGAALGSLDFFSGNSPQVSLAD